MEDLGRAIQKMKHAAEEKAALARVAENAARDVMARAPELEHEVGAQEAVVDQVREALLGPDDMMDLSKNARDAFRGALTQHALVDPALAWDIAEEFSKVFLERAAARRQ